MISSQESSLCIFAQWNIETFFLYTNVKNFFGNGSTSIDLVSTEFLFGSSLVSRVIREGTFFLYFLNKHIIKHGKLNVFCFSKENILNYHVLLHLLISHEHKNVQNNTKWCQQDSFYSKIILFLLLLDWQLWWLTISSLSADVMWAQR